MANTPAIVAKTARRAAERGEGGAGGPVTNSSVIDRANNRLRLKFILLDGA